MLPPELWISILRHFRRMHFCHRVRRFEDLYNQIAERVLDHATGYYHDVVLYRRYYLNRLLSICVYDTSLSYESRNRTDQYTVEFELVSFNINFI
jgi:hypothetical protein